MKKSNIAYEIARNLLMAMKETEAHLAITPCPFCHMTLEVMQPLIESTLNVKIGFPILYFTQLVGLALGFPSTKLGLSKLMNSSLVGSILSGLGFV